MGRVHLFNIQQQYAQLTIGMNVEQANTTITANSNRFNLSMPFGTNQFVQANISVIDCVEIETQNPSISQETYQPQKYR